MKSTLTEDEFDNGRKPEQLELSFRNSHTSVIAYDGTSIVGTARLLSDGVCNAYLVDVWTYTPHRRQGVARTMIDLLLAGVPGQHVYLQSDEPEFYERLGFAPHPTGMAKLVGQWLGGKQQGF